MADEVFRPRKSPAIQQDNQMGQQENFHQPAPQSDVTPFQIRGNVPPEFQAALNSAAPPSPPPQAPPQMAQESRQGLAAGGEGSPFHPSRGGFTGSSHLQEILDNLKSQSSVYEEVQLPSKGRFYDGQNGPTNGILSIRPMTGEEEQILATPRLVKKGQAMNMIFQRCIKEKIRPDELLSIDRTFLLIYLRGISYSSSYEVEIKCPSCDTKFNTDIDLNSLTLNTCPEGFGPQLNDVLPTSKLPFSYRFASGRDENDIQDHRERRIKSFGDSATDDTLTYRTAVLLEQIDGITDKNELQVLIKNLPINDVSYIRNCINEPPFGVDTDVDLVCPSCLEEFNLDLPMESNFFFPRRRRTKTQA